MLPSLAWVPVRGFRLEGAGHTGYEREGQRPCKKERRFPPKFPSTPSQGAGVAVGRPTTQRGGKDDGAGGGPFLPARQRRSPRFSPGPRPTPNSWNSEPGTADVPLTPAMSPALGPRLLPASCHSPGSRPVPPSPGAAPRIPNPPPPRRAPPPPGPESAPATQIPAPSARPLILGPPGLKRTGSRFPEK